MNKEMYLLQERNCPCGSPFMLEVFERTHNDRIFPKMPLAKKMISGLVCTNCKKHIVLFETPLETYLKYNQCKVVAMSVAVTPQLERKVGM